MTYEVIGKRKRAHTDAEDYNADDEALSGPVTRWSPVACPGRVCANSRIVFYLPGSRKKGKGPANCSAAQADEDEEETAAGENRRRRSGHLQAKGSLTESFNERERNHSRYIC